MAPCQLYDLYWTPATLEFHKGLIDVGVGHTPPVHYTLSVVTFPFHFRCLAMPSDAYSNCRVCFHNHFPPVSSFGQAISSYIGIEADDPLCTLP